MSEVVIQHPPARASLKIGALGVGVAACAVCIAAAVLRVEAFYPAYLFAYLFWLGLALGSLALLMLHNLTGGNWGDAIHPYAEAASLTLPVLAVLFIPILLGMDQLYPWMHPNGDEVLMHRRAYLNLHFFVARAAGYFVIWSVLAIVLSALSRSWALEKRTETAGRLRALSAAGIVIYFLTVTHAGFDWLMSRDSEFYSSIFGFVVATGQALAALAFVIVLAYAMRLRVEMESQAKKLLLRDLGNLVLTCVILWAYMAFMQLLIIWMGNKQDDNAWYVQRGIGQIGNPWLWVGLGLVVVHFFVPFFLLLFRGVKQRGGVLAGIAALLLAAHLVEQCWLVAPSGHGRVPRMGTFWIYLVTPVAVGGIWLAAFFWLLGQRLMLREVADAK